MSEKRWRLIRSGHQDGATNMALDRALLISKQTLPTLRLYGWKPWALSLGYFQKEQEFDLAALKAQGYDIVRRPTGGSAIFHADELTYSLTMSEDNPWIPRRIPDSYRIIHEAVKLGLQKLGVDVRFREGNCLPTDSRGNGFCFFDSTACDLVVQDKKIVGSAQRRTKGRLLHHGSIVLRRNPITPEVGSVEAAGGNFDFKKAEAAIARGFAEKFQIEFIDLEPTAEELALSKEIQSLPILSSSRELLKK